jgi:hypothetical protein
MNASIQSMTRGMSYRRSENLNVGMKQTHSTSPKNSENDSWTPFSTIYNSIAWNFFKTSYLTEALVTVGHCYQILQRNLPTASTSSRSFDGDVPRQRMEAANRSPVKANFVGKISPRLSREEGSNAGNGGLRPQRSPLPPCSSLVKWSSWPVQWNLTKWLKNQCTTHHSLPPIEPPSVNQIILLG